MSNILEYARTLFIVINILVHHGITGRRLGNSLIGHDDLDTTNSVVSEALPASDFNEVRRHFNRLAPIRQTIAEASQSFKQYHSNRSMLPDEEVPSKPIYSNSKYEATQPRLSDAITRKHVLDGYAENVNVDAVSTARINPDFGLIGSRALAVGSSQDNENVPHSRGVRQSKNDHNRKIWLMRGSKATIYGRRSSNQCPRLSVRARVASTCTNGRRLGSICHLSCPVGFAPNGRKSRRCELRRHRKSKRHHKSNARWTGRKDDFQCLPICKHFKNPENGDKMCDIIDTPDGKVRKCTTKCNKGYEVKGNPENICKQNGKWSSIPATCINKNSSALSSIRRAKRKRFEFKKFQTLPCGESYGITSFTREGVVYLVVGDKTNGSVKVFRWKNGRFEDTPYQKFSYPSPVAVEIVSSPDGTIWLFVDGGGPTTMYKMLRNGKFIRSHITRIPVGTQSGAFTDAIAFAELRGEFYRCYGRNRRQTPVIVVHKLQGRHAGGGDVFKRIMRKKLPGERVRQCSMFTEGDSLYAVATLHRHDGRGRLMIGHITKNRMKIVGVVSDRSLYQITDSHGFSIEGERYITVSQSVDNGRCVVYKRHWRTRPPEETG